MLVRIVSWVFCLVYPYIIYLLSSTNKRTLPLLHHCTENVYFWPVFKSFMSEKEASSFQDFKIERPLQCTLLHQLTTHMQTEMRQERTGRSNLHKHIIVHVNCQEKEQNASELNTLCRTDRRCYSGKVKFCFHADSHVIKLKVQFSFSNVRSISYSGVLWISHDISNNKGRRSLTIFLFFNT